LRPGSQPPRRVESFSGEALRSPRAGARGDLLTIARFGARRERLDQAAGGGRHLVDGAVERVLVRLRRRIEAAQFPHELDRRGADLLVRRRRIEIEESFDVSTHM
jgi:hypothetical protein